jgi:hypothetical protein
MQVILSFFVLCFPKCVAFNTWYNFKGYLFHRPILPVPKISIDFVKLSINHDRSDTYHLRSESNTTVWYRMFRSEHRKKYVLKQEDTLPSNTMILCALESCD